MKKRVLNYVLRPSNIEGVGVFTNTDIKKGHIIKILDPKQKDTILISVKEAESNSKLFNMCERFGVLSKKGYWVPKLFNQMYIGWYINHSTKPNIGSNDSGKKYYALRDIKANEELTIDYSELDPDIDNSEL